MSTAEAQDCWDKIDQKIAENAGMTVSELREATRQISETSDKTHYILRGPKAISSSKECWDC